MSIGKVGKVVAIAIVGILAVSYGVYALSYSGKYNVTVEATLSTVGAYMFGEAFLMDVSVTSTQMSYVDFWDQLRGKRAAPDEWKTYVVYATLTQGTDIDTLTAEAVLNLDQTAPMVFEFQNRKAGAGTLEFEVVYTYTDTVVFTASYDVRVGP